MHRYLTVVCALSVLILGILTLAFGTHAKRTSSPMQSSSPINVALATNGAVASASSVHFSGSFPVAAVNNGDRKAMNWGNGGGWNDNTRGDYSSDIVQITFPASNFVSQINVFTLRTNFQDNQTPPTLNDTFSTCANSGYGLTEFEVQYWNGFMWATVPGGLVRDNNKVWRQFNFPEVESRLVRVQVHGAVPFNSNNYSRIVEIEAYGRTPGFNLAAAANGAVAVASSQASAYYPSSAVNDGDRTGFNWGRGGFGSGWNDATEGEYSIDWVRIDFAGGQARRINEIDVYTLRDEFSTKPDDPTTFETFSTADNSGSQGITDYDVQYLSGGVWRNVPGGKVTNNNKVRRQFRFSPITTNAIRVAVHKGVNYTSDINWSTIVEIEAWENAATPDDVVWVEDALPAGAIPTGSFEGWAWTCFKPLPLSGTLAHTSDLLSGLHQHYFYNATQTLTVNAGDTLVAHVYLDPVNAPTQVMLQWNDGTWEHRAYWGENQIGWGVDGTVSRRNMGALPPTGQWVRLEVPASLVGLEGRTLNGMAFTLFNGRAIWDHAGKYAGSAPVQPTISISDATVNEGNSGTTLAVFNVTLSSASTQTISINYATANSTASSPSDYVGASGTVTISPGQTSRPISIQAVGDTVLESNENFFVNLSNPVNATLADSQAVGTIFNDDALPSISISDITFNEGNSGTTSAVFNVTLSSASAQMIDVNYATANGSAAGGTDYFAASGTVTFAAGQTSKPISIQVVGDTAVEVNESFFVNLSGAVNATLADGQGVGTILNDDVSISYFEIPVYFHVIQDDVDSDGHLNGYVDESKLDAQIELLNRAFNSADNSPDTDNFTNNGGDIANVRFFFWKAGVDRVSNHGWFEMEPGTQVTPGAEYFAPSAEYEAKSSLRQGGANALNFYTVRGATPLQGSPPDSPRFAWATFAESYKNNSCVDGVVVPFTMLPEGGPDSRFNKGKIGIHEVGHWLGLYHTYQGGCEVVNDQVDDTPAHLQPSLGNCPTNSPDTCSSSSFPGIDPIHNFMTDNFDACKTHFTTGQFLRMKNQYQTHRQSNMTPPECPIVAISISDATVVEGNSGNTPAVFTVTLSRPITQRIKVSFETANDTASSGSDYFGFGGGSLSFDPDPEHPEQILSRSFSIDVIGDTAPEANENFFVNLVELGNAKLADGQGIGTIINDDALPTISISDATVIEGNSGFTSAVFNVTLSNASTQLISVNYATANGTATSPSDYLARSGTVNFASGETQSITIPVVGDTAVESNENFFVNLSGAVNATLADSQGVGTILNDDVLPVYEGWVDIADCNSIIGWAADRNRLNTSITVSIYDGENFVTSVPASDLRTDVGAYLGDNGRHGFAILTPLHFKDGLPHSLRVKFESSTTELGGASPRTITCVAYYEIVARHSGKCLDVEGESMASGARVIQFVCGGWANQQWQVIPVSGEYFKIVARHSGKVLDVQGAGLDNGTPVWQWDENSTPAQQWQIIDVGGGYVRIMARHSGKVLDVSGISTADGAQIHQWDYVGIANQQWLLRLVP